MHTAAKYFMGTNPEVMALLPKFVQEAFPLYLTKKGAIDKEMLDMLHIEICTTSNFSAASAKFKEMSHKHRLQLELLYSQYCKYRVNPRQSVAGTMHQHFPVVSTSKIDTSNVSIDTSTTTLLNYNPSANWLSAIFLETTQEHMQWMRRYLTTITGTALAMDHTFKVTNSIRAPDRQKLYEACFTVMNETCQVVAQYMVQTKSWLEVRHGLLLLCKRYSLIAEDVGKPLEELVSCGLIGMACMSHEMISSVCSWLQQLLSWYQMLFVAFHAV